MEYSEDAKRVLEKLEVAKYPTTLDFLAMLAKQEGGLAHEILFRYGIEENAFERPFFQENSAEREGGYCREIREKAEEIAKNSGERADTQHLLAGLCAFPKCEGAKYLKQRGISFEEVNGVISSMTQYGMGKGYAEPAYNAFPRYDGGKSARPTEPFKNETKEEIFRKILTKSKEEGLCDYGADLTEAARRGRLDPVVGREKEIDRLMEILCRRTKNNPVLIGEAGVGKTALAEGLALRIAAGNVPPPLRGKRIFSLDMGKLLAGTRYRGDLEERLQTALEASKENTVLFLDEIHTLLSAGDKEGGMTVANLIKPMLARGEISVIGATTAEEYRKYVEKDGALARRFQPVYVAPPDGKRALEILKGLRSVYEAHHRVVITDEGLDAAVRLSEKYIVDRYLPDKAIDLMDETASKVRIRSGKPVVGFREVAFTLSEWMGIPIRELTENRNETSKNIKNNLSEQVFGQENAVGKVTNALQRVALNAEKPRGVFLFVGKDGVGKRTLATALSKEICGGNALLRFDMGEYRDEGALNRLIGAAPGYLGHAEGGRLVEAVRKQPYGVVLFEKADCAHPDVLRFMARVVKEGEFTDSRGKKAVFRNCILIFSVDMALGTCEKQVGFAPRPPEREDDAISEPIRKRFPQEFLESIDEIVPFAELTQADLERAACKEIGNIQNAFTEKGIAVILTEDAKAEVLRESCPEGGTPYRTIEVVRRRIGYSAGDALTGAERREKAVVTVRFSLGKWAYDIN